MPYSTSTSIYIGLPGLTNNSTTTDVIAQQIVRVGGKIDAYVSSRYDVTGWTSPSSTPQIIQDISDRLVMKRSMLSLFTMEGQNKNEWVMDLAKEALKDLEAINKGKILVTLAGSEESTSTKSKSTRSSFTPIFDVDDPLDQLVDPDLLDDINSDRQ